MTTPHRTLREAAQMALDALLTGYHQGTQDAIAALREALAAPQAEPVGTVYTMEALVPGGELRCHATLHKELPAGTKLYAAPPAAPAPVAPVVREPRHVRKVGGSFQHTGTVVAEFRTTAGEPRIVLEFDAPVAGMLHVYRPDQVEPCEPAAPAATSASPAVPLTNEQIDSVIRDVAELDYSSPEGMPDVMLVTANELRGILQAHGITGGSNG